MKRILVGTDGSASSAGAVAFAVELAAEHAAELLVVHVVPLFHPFPSYGLDESGTLYPYEPTPRDHDVLRQAAETASRHGVAVRTELLTGPAADEIVRYAESVEADVVVVGSRGHSAVVNALVGSVSRRVLRTSKQPVLVVRGTPALDRVA